MTRYTIIIATMMFVMLFSCNQPKLDKELKADINLKAKDDLNFAGIQYTVENKIVTLSGKVPTAKSKESLVIKLRSIHMIDSINDQLVISPITLDSNFAIKQKIDSVLADYPTVAAEVLAGKVILKGKIKDTELSGLMRAVQPVSPAIIGDQLLHTTIN